MEARDGDGEPEPYAVAPVLDTEGVRAMAAIAGDHGPAATVGSAEQSGGSSAWSGGAAVLSVGSAVLLLGALLLPAAVPPAAAQEEDAAPAELSISTARTDDHPTVQVTVDVPSIGGELDIGPEAFTLTEDGEERAVEVERLASEDLEVMLVIDSSGSMAGVPIEAAQAAALEFVAQMPPAVEIAVTRFSTEVELLSDFTTDRQETITALEGLSSQVWTSMYDAVHTALDVFDEREATREAIVLLSDGGDNRSEATLEETVERLSGRDEVLTIVELITAERPEARERFGRDDPDADAVDLAALGSLADAAGQGSVVSPDDLDALTEVYEDIAATLLNQYELTFTSQAADAAELVVRFEHEGVVAEGSRTIELPAAPEEPEPEPESTEEVEELEDGLAEPDDEAALPTQREPPATGWWTEPWAFNTAVVVFIVGLIGGLIYSHGWRLRDRFESQGR